MGIHDSSRTRVAPVFGRLQCLDPSGRLWLQGLLELANTRTLPRPEAGASRLRVAKWWPREAKLAAPPALLRWLLENAQEPRDAAAWGRRPEVMANRRRVVDRDADTLAGALQSLQDRRPSPRAWYVLEGPSQPDVYLDSDDVVIVVEGKRTADRSDDVDGMDERAASDAPAPRRSVGASAGPANLRPVHRGGRAGNLVRRAAIGLARRRRVDDLERRARGQPAAPVARRAHADRQRPARGHHLAGRLRGVSDTA